MDNYGIIARDSSQIENDQLNSKVSYPVLINAANTIAPK